MAQKKIGFTKGSAQADRLILNNGLTATTQISFSGASSLTFSLPQTNGASGQVIVTDGAGNLSFAAAVPGVSGFALGSAATPSIFFTADTDTGIFRNGTNQLGFSTGGSLRLLVGTTTIQSDLVHIMNSDLRIANGTLGVPSLRFTNDLDTGIFRPTGLTNTIGISCGGATAAIFEADGIRFDQAPSAVARIKFGGTSSTTGIFQTVADEIRIKNNNSETVLFSGGRTFLNSSAPTNLAASPNLSFQNDSDTGIFRPAADQLSITCGGTVSAQFDSTGIGMPVGTFTQPALKFTNDPDTGFYRPRTVGPPSLLINNAIAIACGGQTASMFDASSGANETRLLLFDVTANTLVRVSRGPADSGGTGSRALIIPN